MGGADFDLAALAAPIPVVEDEPAPPVLKTDKNINQTPAKNEIIRKVNQSRVDENFITPDKISTVPNRNADRPREPFKIGETDSGTETRNYSAAPRGTVGGSGISDNRAESNQPTETEIVKPPPPPPLVEKPKEQPRKNPVSLGVVNGKATFLPKPPYPPAARAVRASGAVNVQVTIDETGKVIESRAVSGNSLLREAAERAARNARFAPTLLSNQPVKVSGVIVYNFVAE